MPKPMNKVLKLILIAGGVLAGLVTAGMIGVAAYIHVKYPPEKMKSMATEKLSEVLKHKVSVGNVAFNMLTGFKITNLKINNRPGWADAPMVLAKDISISYHLYGLVLGYFAGQISLGEIRLDQPQILVERRGLGQFNFSDMGGPPPAVAEAPSRSPAPPKTKGKLKAKPKSRKKARHAAVPVPRKSLSFAKTSGEKPTSFSFVDQAWADTPSNSGEGKKPNSTMLVSIESININHGKMTYLDETSSPAQKSDLSDLNLKIKNISMAGGNTSFSLSTPFTYAKMDYQLVVDGKFRYFADSQSLKELAVDGKVNDLGFKLAGDALNMTGNFTPSMDGEASLDMLKFSGLVPRSLSSMPEGLSLTGPARVNFHLGGNKRDGLALSGTADGSGLVIQYKDFFIKTNKTTCKVDFKSVNKLDQGLYDLPSFKVVYENWDVTGAFHYHNGSFSGEAHSKSLPFKGLPGMVPKLKNTTIDGGGSLDATFSKAANNPNSLKLFGKVILKGVGITLPKEPYLQDMNGSIVLDGNVVRVPGITFKSFDGAGAVGVTYVINSQNTQFGFRLKDVNAQKAIDSSIDAYVTTKKLSDYKDKLYGNLNLVYSGAFRGFSGDQMINTSVGSGNYSLDKAKMKGFAVIKAINKYFKDQSDEMPFDQVVGNLGMKNKVFSYTASTIGKVGAIREAGAINVADMVYAPDMKIQCDLKKEFLNSDSFQAGLPAEIRALLKNPDWVADDRGNIPVDVKFTGKVKENNYSYDWTRLKQNVENKAGQVLKKAAQEVLQNNGKDIGEKLKGLFGH